MENAIMEKRAPTSTAVKCGQICMSGLGTFRFVLFVVDPPPYNGRKKKRVPSSQKETDRKNPSFSLILAEKRKNGRVEVIAFNNRKPGLKSRRNNFCVGGARRFHGSSIRETSFHGSFSLSSGSSLSRTRNKRWWRG